MKAGLGVSQVNDELNALATRIAQRTPETNKGVQLIAKPVNQQFNGRITDAVWIAFISVGGLLVLIACSNVANLLLARSVQRSREIAIRVSMGATRWRIVRQLLVEGMLLAAIGGLLGLGLSFLGLRILTSADSGRRVAILGQVHDGWRGCSASWRPCVSGQSSCSRWRRLFTSRARM